MENFDNFAMSYNFWQCSQMHRLCYTVTCNDPGHKKPGVCFQKKFISSLSTLSFFYQVYFIILMNWDVLI